MIAIHELGGDGPDVVYAHATGFHGRCWQPTAALLPQFRNVSFDARGHGDTPAPPDWAVDWTVYGSDAAHVAEFAAGDGPVIGVGHSMGGASLLMAAAARPELFRALGVYEPIVFPTDAEGPPGGGGSMLAVGARRRRSTFDSMQAALDNFSAKPPMNAFTPDTIEAYVRYGFTELADGSVTLKCVPELEARTYDSGGLHATWDLLGDIQVPVWVVSGVQEPMQPSRIAPILAAKIPGSTYVCFEQYGHFGPMQAPSLLADLVTQVHVTLN